MAAPSSIIALLLRIALGIFFLIVGIIKVRDLDAFTENVFNYQILFPPYDGYAAYLVAWLEVIAGISITIGLWGLRGGLVMIAGLIWTFIFALSISMAKGLNIRCGCFSSSDEPTNFPLHIGFNVILLAITLGLLWHQMTQRRYLFKGRRLQIPK